MWQYLISVSGFFEVFCIVTKSHYVYFCVNFYFLRNKILFVVVALVFLYLFFRVRREVLKF